MNIDWLSYWLGFGAFPALFMLVFTAVFFIISIVFAIRGRFDDSDEEEADDEDVNTVPGNHQPRIPSQGADVDVPSDCELTEDDIRRVIRTFNSSLDEFLNYFSECLDDNYKALDKLKPGKHDKKIAKVEDNIFNMRFRIAIISFIQAHGTEAFLNYLDAESFFDVDKLRARSVCDPFAPMPADYPPLEEDKP